MPRSKWFVAALKKGFPQRILFSRLTKIPIIGQMVDHMLFEGDDILYLPKDEVIQINKAIDRHGEMVLPSQVVDYFIEKSNYHWIMDWCICRSSSSCTNYPIDLGCLFLGEAAVHIDPRLGRQVSKEEAHSHVKKCRDVGLVHLIGRNKLDTFWLKVGPGEKLLTICNCCECCCLWRILPYVSKTISNKVKKMPGVKVEVNPDLCIGCGTCTKNICFVKAIQLINKKAVISDLCRGCGRCVDVCPQHAISLSITGLENVSEVIDRINSLVDVS